MEFTREQRQAALKTLPQETRDFLFSDKCINGIQSIGKTNGLLLDKVGDLEDLIFLVIYGLLPATKFIDSIQSKLGVTSASAQKIGNEVNDSIFLKIRSVLQETKPQVTPTSESLQKEDILAEIENPTPSTPPITVPSSETAVTVAHDFIGSKLTQTVAIPSQKAMVSLQPPASQTIAAIQKPAPKPATYSADPYRESIN